jgi:hypothetical protein
LRLHFPRNEMNCGSLRDAAARDIQPRWARDSRPLFLYIYLAFSHFVLLFCFFWGGLFFLYDFLIFRLLSPWRNRGIYFPLAFLGFWLLSALDLGGESIFNHFYRFLIAWWNDKCRLLERFVSISTCGRVCHSKNVLVNSGRGSLWNLRIHSP